MTKTFTSPIEEILENENALLTHKCKTLPKEALYLPGPDFIDNVMSLTDRNAAVLRNFGSMVNHGRLAGTGYLSILPVDQGIEHSAGSAFAPNPEYFDPARIVELAIEGGCNAVASTMGVLGAVARRFAHKIPFILKLNHNELLSYPNTHDQTMFGSVERAFDMGCVGVGATVYWGSAESRRQLEEASQAFQRAHELGLFTVLWCYVRNPEFQRREANYETAADLTNQANHLGVTIEADLIKQKAPTCDRGFEKIGFGKTDPMVYEKLSSDNPIDQVRYQVAGCYMGRVGLINSGGPSGDDDLVAAVKTAIINKRGGGCGLISGRKAFQKPFRRGIELLNAIQDVYLNDEIDIA